MFLIQKIEELMMNYHDARHAVGEFVLQEKENLYNYTINEVAEQSFTSKATVVRFAKTLGFDGWRDFMKAYVSEIKYEEQHQGDVDANYPFSETSSVDEIVEGIKNLQIESIQDTANLMDYFTLEQATRYLKQANRVVIFGHSPNFYVAELFRRKMITIGKNVEISGLGSMGIMSRTLNSKDCAIMISYSGNNENMEPMCYLPILLEHKVKVIGITSGGDNYLRRELSCVFTMSSKERLYTKISNFATEESLQFILNCLFSNYFSKAYQDNYKFKLEEARILEKKRLAVLAQMMDKE